MESLFICCLFICLFLFQIYIPYSYHVIIFVQREKFWVPESGKLISTPLTPMSNLSKNIHNTHSTLSKNIRKLYHFNQTQPKDSFSLPFTMGHLGYCDLCHLGLLNEDSVLRYEGIACHNACAIAGLRREVFYFREWIGVHIPGRQTLPAAAPTPPTDPRLRRPDQRHGSAGSVGSAAQEQPQRQATPPQPTDGDQESLQQLAPPSSPTYEEAPARPKRRRSSSSSSSQETQEDSGSRSPKHQRTTSPEVKR